MPYVVTIVGKSNSGKTTLVERLVPVLKKKNLVIGTIKHTSHGFAMDKPGKDSYRHKQSGADITAISGPKQMALVRDMTPDLTLHNIIDSYFGFVDLVIVEGYKQENFPKIEIVHNQERVIPEDDPQLLAVVSDQQQDTDKPSFGRNAVSEIAEFILKVFAL